jgi:hypothetical protein
MRETRAWTDLARVLGFGALYDLAFGVAILAFTEPAAALLGLAVPDDPVYLHLNGVFLVLLAGLYALAAFEPRRYEGIAPVAAAGRGIGFLILTRAWLAGGPKTFLFLGLADLAIGAVTLALWLRARRLAPSA